MSTVDFVLGPVPQLDGSAPEVLIIAAPYYREIVDGMIGGAEAVLHQIGARHQIAEVAGAYELPQALRLAAKGRHHFDGFIAIGCVIKGETDHYDFICRSAMDGIMNVALDHALCLGTALLTVDTLEQAEARSGAAHNKGAEAAVALIKQIAFARRLAA